MYFKLTVLFSILSYNQGVSFKKVSESGPLVYTYALLQNLVVFLLYVSFLSLFQEHAFCFMVYPI